jgi:inhibitor of cysteine peptidase
MFHRSLLVGRVPVVLASLVAGGLAGLSGCNPADADAVTITELSAGGMIELRTGQTLRVMLECNPSTGYGWDPTLFDATILEQQRGTEFVPDNPAPGITGTPGTMTISFRAISAGRTPLRLIYHRPTGYDTSAIQTLEMTVVVRDG